MIPLPDRVPVVRERSFEFGRSGGAEDKPWTIKVDNGTARPADMTNISAAPKPGTAEIWTLVNGGGGWDHPVHIHFEEGQTLSRNGKTPPDWERLAARTSSGCARAARSSLPAVPRVRGTFMEHCHNTRTRTTRCSCAGTSTRRRHAAPTPIPSPSGCTFVDSTDK